MTDKQKQTIYRRRRKGETLEAISQDFGITRERVRQLCEIAGVYPEVRCRRCRATYVRTGNSVAPLCPACRERRCTVCGHGFSRDQLVDDADAHRSCRRVNRGATSGATYRAVERGIYRRSYKATGVPLNGYFVSDGRRYIRCETLAQARKARKDVLLARGRAKE